MSSHTVHRITRLGAFLVPVVLVKGASFLLGTSTAVSVSADVVNETPVDPSMLAPPKMVWSAEELFVAEYISTLSTQTIDGTPMYHRDDPGDAAAVPDVPDKHGIDKDPPSRFNLTVIMASAHGGTALIDGRRYNVGSTLPDSEWRITEISIPGRSVTLYHETRDETYVLEVRTNPD